MTRSQTAVLIGACSLTALLRVRELPFHIDSMIALSVLCGALVPHRLALLIPLLVRLGTDLLIAWKTDYGFYPSMVFDYAAYLAIAGIAQAVRRSPSVRMIAGGILGPVLFYLISNFGVWWLWPDTYAHTFAGLTQCYAQGLPFLRSSITGNLPMAIMFLAAWQLATALSSQPGLQTATDKLSD